MLIYLSHVGAHSLLGQQPPVASYDFDVQNPKGESVVAVLHQFDRAKALADVIRQVYKPMVQAAMRSTSV